MIDWYNIVPHYFNRRNYYKKFVREIIEDKPLSDLKELESKRESLKFLFEHCPKLVEYDEKNDSFKYSDNCPDLIELLSSKDNYYWYNYINTVIFLVQNANNEDIKNENLEKLYNVFGNNHPETFINIIFAIMLPEILIKDHIISYLAAFDRIIDKHGPYWKEKVDTGNERLNELFDYLYELSKESQLPNDYCIRIESFIIAYLYLNNIKDYSSIRNFTLYTDYYLEKMKLNKCEILNQFGTYDFDSIEFLFNNFSDIFCAPKMIIK